MIDEETKEKQLAIKAKFNNLNERASEIRMIIEFAQTKLRQMQHALSTLDDLIGKDENNTENNN